eukprot:TRINITY_DN11460_c0_g1_i1.p1 TRINITY_DN11460_c0_g1~~TRINITY_DN11460_c0_g1_i1.p1  ORF type:complete len:574 (-),score=100.81 TRINITY_DN11460_c0_g1_i1:146-1867(-)
MHPLLTVLLLTAVALGNVPVPSNFQEDVMFPYGKCTDPYKNAAANNWKVGESVQSGSQGKTCNFNPNGAQGLAGLPALYRQGYLLAASQDLYNGFHTADNFATTCDTSKAKYANAAAGKNMCGQTCGECFLVNGDLGSAVFMVNEIADIAHVGQNGKGLDFHLDHRHRAEVSPTGAVSRNIQFKRVPCPTTGSIQVRISNNWGPWATFFVIYNYRVGLRKVEISGMCNLNKDPSIQCDSDWIPLPRSWTNEWHWEFYDCAKCPKEWNSKIKGMRNVYRTSGKDANTPYQLRLTSVSGEQVICSGIISNKAGKGQKGTIYACVDASGKPQQFNKMPADNKPCAGGGGSTTGSTTGSSTTGSTTGSSTPPPSSYDLKLYAPNSPFPTNSKYFRLNMKKNSVKYDGKPSWSYASGTTGTVILRYVASSWAWVLTSNPNQVNYNLYGFLQYGGQNPCSARNKWRVPKSGTRMSLANFKKWGNWNELNVQCTNNSPNLAEGAPDDMQNDNFTVSEDQQGGFEEHGISNVVVGGLAAALVVLAVAAVVIGVMIRKERTRLQEVEEYTEMVEQQSLDEPL